MNESFFNLPDEKRSAIINAAFRVFSKHGYKKSPMNEIAAEAGISKSLLFYYFKNKKELYLYLAKYSAEINEQEMKRQGCFEKDNMFDVLISGLFVKTELMRRCPDLALFELNGYFEKEPEIRKDIHDLISRYSSFETQSKAMLIDPEQFAEGLDLEMMYKMIYFAAEGYLWEKLNCGKIDPDEMERDYLKMAEFWKKLFLRNGTEGE